MTVAERTELNELIEHLRRLLTSRDMDRRIQFLAVLHIQAALIALEFPDAEHDTRIESVQQHLPLYVNLYRTRERRIIP